MGFYEEAIKPFTKDRGLDWEVAISEGDVSFAAQFIVARIVLTGRIVG